MTLVFWRDEDITTQAVNYLLFRLQQSVAAPFSKKRQSWEFHKSGLYNIGYALDRRRLLLEAMRELATELRSPVAALRKFKVALEEGRHQ